MSALQEQSSSQISNQVQINRKEIEEKLKEMTIQYIKNNETEIVLQKLTDDILEHSFFDTETIIEETSRFMMLVKYTDELTNNVDFDFYLPTLDHNLFGYSINEVKITYIRLYKEKVEITMYLPNNQLVGEIRIWYDTVKLLYKDYQEKLKSIENFVTKIVDTLVKIRKKVEELEEKLEKHENREEEGEEEEEDQ